MNFAWLVLAGCMVALWGLSLRLRDSSIVDLFWGPAFAIVAWVMVAQLGATPRGVLVASLVTVWGLRLGLYLAQRNLGHGEDKRYVAMRKKHGDAWWWRSAFIVFGLQGVLVWVVSMPVRAVIGAPFEGWAWSDGLAIALVVFGVAFESIGDWQLTVFKRNPANKGKIMTSGLWRYTRHPNYFGDFVTWWGLGVFGVASGAWWSVIGPIVMSVLLIRVSGKALLEAGMKGRPGFDEYEKATSGFFPWWPLRKS
jgi:steroid 5-alpha reductase family enzyme